MPFGNSENIDRDAFSVISVREQQADEIGYWRDKTPVERLRAVELTRQILYGRDTTTARLQRVLEIAERA